MSLAATGRTVSSPWEKLLPEARTASSAAAQQLPLQHSRADAWPSSWNLPNDSVCAWTFWQSWKTVFANVLYEFVYLAQHRATETPAVVSSGAGWTRWSFAVAQLCCPFSPWTLVPGLARKGALKDSWAPAELGTTGDTSSCQKVWFSPGRLGPLRKSESAARQNPVQREAFFVPAEHSRRAHQEMGELRVHGELCRLSVHPLATFSTPSSSLAGRWAFANPLLGSGRLPDWVSHGWRAA